MLKSLGTCFKLFVYSFDEPSKDIYFCRFTVRDVLSYTLADRRQVQRVWWAIASEVLGQVTTQRGIRK